MTKKGAWKPREQEIRLILPAIFCQIRGLIALHHTEKEPQLEGALTGSLCSVLPFVYSVLTLTTLVNTPSEEVSAGSSIK